MKMRKQIAAALLTACLLAQGALTAQAAGTVDFAQQLQTLRWYPSQTFTISGGEKGETASNAPQAEQEAAVEEDYSGSYRESDYYRRLGAVQLTGDQRQDILAVARSQVGYREGDGASQLDGETAGSRDYTEYGRLLGTQGTAWCSEFASWCARQAGIPASVFGNAVSAVPSSFGGTCYQWAETVYAGGDYKPQPGDVILFAWDGTSTKAKALSHTALLERVTQRDGSPVLHIIHGNSGNSVKESEIEIENPATGRMYQGYAVYIISPDYAGAARQ